MSEPQSNEIGMIHFRCPQCTRPWKVEAKHAGKKFRCPACFVERTIPDKSVESPGDDQLYGVNETVHDTQEIIRKQSLVSFSCKICRTNLAVSTDLVGQTTECPDCGTVNIVPEPQAKEQPIMPDEPVEIYSIAGFGDGTADHEDESLFSVQCPLCGTMLYARDEQIGTSLKCPDCYRDVPVQRRPEKPVKEEFVAKVYEGSSTYELSDANRLPPDTQLVPVICSLCYTRMYATIDQIGQEKECPDCGKMNPIKVVVQEEIKTAAELFPPVSGYGVGEVVERPKMRVGVDYRTVEGAVVEREPNPTDGTDFDLDPTEMAERIHENKKKEEERKKKKKRKKSDDGDEDDDLTEAERIENRANKRSANKPIVTYRRVKLPKRPLTQGYWKIFRYMSFHVHLILAMLFFFLAAPLVVQLVVQYSPDVKSLAGGSPGTVTIYLFMYLFASIFLMGGACYLSQICLAVSVSTSNGADEVDEWGGFSPMMSLGSLLCVGGSVAIGWAPVILWNAYNSVIKSPDGVPEPLMLFCAVASFFVFPVAMMRYLEGFHKHVIKGNTFWSLRLIPQIWFRFYMLSIPCVIVPGLLIWRLLYSPHLNVKTICSFGLAFFLPFCAMCYFRLFGRLGWAAETAIDKKIRELEEQAAEEENDDF